MQISNNNIFQYRPMTILVAITSVLLFASCDEEAALPRPHAYPKVDFPVRAYKPFEAGYCQMTFEQPVYAQIVRDTTFFDQKAGSDCWFNLDVPQLNASIHCSYYPINNRARFDELVADAFELVSKHNVKASYIEEVQFERPAQKVYGTIYNIEGPAASPYQFYATDSVRHFLRGALYFRTQARPDSLAPVTEFMKKDINRLVETLRWK